MTIPANVAVAVNPPAWYERHPPNAPATPGAAFASATDAARGVVLMVTGDETWTWDGANWVYAGKVPPPAVGSLSDLWLAFDPAHGEMVLFRALWADGANVNDTLTWDGTGWTARTPATSPPTRYRTTLATDGANNRVLLFGGAVAGSDYNDTWAWTGTTWTQLFPSTPPTAYLGTMTYDAARGAVLFFGINQGVQTTWTWNGSNWTQRLTSTVPVIRFGGSMAYDPRSQKVIMVGEEGSFPYGQSGDEVWAWNGSDWVAQIFPAGKAPYLYWAARLAYDPVDNVLVFHDTSGETWLYYGDGGVDVNPYPSDDCFSGVKLIDGYFAGVYVKLVAGGTGTVCVRVDGGTAGAGGAIVSFGSLTLPSVTSDDRYLDCQTVPGNQMPGPHPLVAGALGSPSDPTYTPYLVDSYIGPNGVWVCVGVGSMRVRYIVTTAAVVNPPAPYTVPDKIGNHRPYRRPPAEKPSASCQTGTQTLIQVVDASFGDNNSAVLYALPTARGARLCVRVGGTVAVGGVVDVTTADSALLVVDGNVSRCTSTILSNQSPVRIVLAADLGAEPSVCLTTDALAVRVGVNPNGGSPPGVTWTPDPGTPGI